MGTNPASRLLDREAEVVLLRAKLLMNHSFVDGNKRVAFFAIDVFLRLNGWWLKVDGRRAHRFLVGLLEQNTADYEHLLPWIRRPLAPLR